MDPVTLGLISMGVGGAVKLAGDLFDNTDSQQASLLRQQAALKQSALEEGMRRAEGAQTQVLSSTKARMAGSGFSGDSQSFTGYLSGMAEQFAAQNKFTKDQGMGAIQMMRDSADSIDNPLHKGFKIAGDLAGTGMAMANLFRIGQAPPPAAAVPGVPKPTGSFDLWNSDSRMA